MLDEEIHAFRQEMQAKWDNLRERRVLRRVELRLAQDSSQTPLLRRRAVTRGFSLAIAVVTLVVAYGIGVDAGRKRAAESTNRPAQTAPVTPPQATASAGRHLEGAEIESRVLADGSRLELWPDAHVEVRSVSSGRVELAQSGGQVHYEVAHIPEREFVVMAGGVRVKVTGTAFVVRIDAGTVSVKVERGRVLVADFRREVELQAGEEIATSVYEAPDATPNGPPTDSAPAPLARRAPEASALSAGALLERADAERRSGDFGSAAGTLEELVRRYPRDRRVALAWFTLGKVDRTLDRATDAAASFRQSFSLAREASLVEDALAEEAAAWEAAGNTTEARAAAQQYVGQFPRGAHAARMRRILQLE